MEGSGGWRVESGDREVVLYCATTIVSEVRVTGLICQRMWPDMLPPGQSRRKLRQRCTR